MNQASSAKGTDTATAVTIRWDIREGGKDESEYSGQSNLSVSHSMGQPFGDNAHPEGQEVTNVSSDITAARGIGMVVRRHLSTHHKNKRSL